MYQLYQGGAIDKVNDTLFCAAGVPGALSKDVLDYQVPQVERFFSDTGTQYRKVVTLTLGGNDLLQILGAGADPNVVLPGVGSNLAQILARLVSQFPEARIYVANYNDPKLPVPGGRRSTRWRRSFLKNAWIQAMAGAVFDGLQLHSRSTPSWSTFTAPLMAGAGCF